MSNPEQDNQTADALDQDILEELDQLDGNLREELLSDERLGDGIPQEHRTDDIDFIRMSGLAAPPGDDDLDPSKPVSFFEKGVDDVDASMSPGTLGDEESEDADFVPASNLEEPVRELRDILSELRQTAEAGTAAAGDPEKADDGAEGGLAAVETGPGEEAGTEKADDVAPGSGVPYETDAGEGRQDEQIESPEYGEEALMGVDAGPPDDGAFAEKDPGGGEETGAAETGGGSPEHAEADVESGPVSAVAHEDESEIASARLHTGDVDYETPAAGEGEVLPAEEAESMEEEGQAEADDDEGGAYAGIAAYESRPPSKVDLEEAERLVNELQSQPRDAEPVAVPEATQEASAEPGREVPPDQPPRRHGRRRSQLNRNSRRRTFRVLLSLLVLAAAGAGGYYGYQHYGPQVLALVKWTSPESLFESAQALAEEGEYARAAAAFDSFAELHPGHRLAPEAQFLAAYQLTRVDEAAGAEARAAYEKAITRFERFLQENPGLDDTKRARAEILQGVLYVKLGRPAEAVEILDQEELRLRDPGASLAVLRNLGRAFGQLGNLQAARDYLVEAAHDPASHAPDKDYAALAQLYEEAAPSASSPSAEAEYLSQAYQYWREASQVAGISPAGRQRIRVKMESLAKRLEEEPVPAPSGGPAAGPTAEQAAEDAPVEQGEQDQDMAGADQQAQGVEPGTVDSGVEEDSQ